MIGVKLIRRQTVSADVSVTPKAGPVFGGVLSVIAQ